MVDVVLELPSGAQQLDFLEANASPVNNTIQDLEWLDASLQISQYD